MGTDQTALHLQDSETPVAGYRRDCEKKTLTQLIFTTEDTEDAEENSNAISILFFSVLSVLSVVNLLVDEAVNVCLDP